MEELIQEMTEDILDATELIFWSYNNRPEFLQAMERAFTIWQERFNESTEGRRF